MNKAIIMIGSNTNTTINIQQAIDILEKQVLIVGISPQIRTEPVGKYYISDFENLAIEIQTELEYENLKQELKIIESQAGRTSAMKTEGIVPLDLDIIIWNNKIIHKDFERFWFVRECIQNIHKKGNK